MTFDKWLDTLIEEKGLGEFQTFEVNGPDGLANFIPLGCIVSAIKDAPGHEQTAIRNTLVKIDFANGDITHYFKHLAQAIAI